jgi:signal peptidase I
MNALKCELASEVLRLSGSLQVRATGWSMLPTVWPGDTLVIERIACADVSEGDIVMFKSARRFVAHRVVNRSNEPTNLKLQTRGDALPRPDAAVPSGDLLGKVSYILRSGKSIQPQRNLRFSERVAAAVFRHSEIAARVVVRLHGIRRAMLRQTQMQSL